MASTSVHLPLPPPFPATQTRSHATPTTFASPKPKPTLRSKLSKLCQDGQPHLARQLFDALPRPNTVLWNTIIIGFICNNLPEEALSVYARMKSSSPTTKSDPYTFSSTLKACADTQNLAAGKAVHGHIIRSMRRPSGIVQNSLLNMYSVCAAPESGYVRKVFDKMPKRNVVAWNTLVTWHARAERNSEALSEFARMVRVARVRPSPVSFVGVFPALSGLKDHRNADLIYGMLVKMGSEYVKDLFVVSSAIFMFGELGRVDSARKVFDLCEEKNTEIWNTMIGSYVQNNLPNESIELLLEAVLGNDTTLDEVTLLSALAAVSQLQRPDFARETHAFVLRNSPEKSFTSTALENAIVSMYSKCDSVGSAFKLFRAMADRDVVSWNTMVSSLVHNSSDEEAILIVREMQSQGFSIDHVTVSALLSAASNLRDSSVGKQTHGYMIRHGIEFDGMESYLADMYSKSGLVKSLKTIFEKGNSDGRDLATWNSIIAGYSQNGLSGEAFLAFRLMIERGLNPNSITLSSILPACNSAGNVDPGKQIHGFAIRRNLDGNVFVGSALIDVYSKSGEIFLAEKLFLRRLSSEEKNSVTYTNMISGYGQHGMGYEALSLFRSMKSLKVDPDEVTFIAILSACSHCGLVDEGLEIFESMEIQPSIAHFCCVADMLGRAGRVFEAHDFVTGLGPEGDVPEVWGPVLAACGVHGEFELGRRVAEKMAQSGNADVAGYRVLLSNILAGEGEWESVGRVRKEMRERGLRKETARSWIETSRSVNRFSSRDRSHDRSDEIYDVLDHLVKEMRASRTEIIDS